MNYPKEYFQTEIKGDFEVTAMMKRCWASQMEVLQQFDSICRKNGISYFLAYGTLLGAVRNGGFIPWDDDIDLWMKREDLDKLIRLADRDIADLGLELITPFNDERYDNLVYRLINTRRYCLEERFLKKYWMFPFMAGLDIFPLDYVTRETELLEQQRILMISANTLAKEWRQQEIPIEEKRETYRQLIEIFGVQPVEEMKIPNQLMMLTDRIGGIYGKEDGDMVATLPYYFRNTKKIFCKEWFETTVIRNFEGLDCPIPGEYQKVLETEFGDDYLIPRRVGGDHEYPYYKNAHRCLLQDFAKMGIRCPDMYLDL